MNYLKQSVAFFELQLTTQVSANAQAVYYTLFNINNKCRWKEKFTTANTMLTAYTGLNERAIMRARDELIELGLIEYESGKGYACGTYSLKKLYEEDEEEDEKMQNDCQTTDKIEAKTTEICQSKCSKSVGKTATLNKQNKTKENETNKTKQNERVKETKNAYGEHARVLLSESEYALLGEKFANRDELIKFLDEYIEMKGGYDADSHYMAIIRWVAKAVEERKAASSPPKYGQNLKGTLNNFSQDMPDFEAIERVVLERQRQF